MYAYIAYTYPQVYGSFCFIMGTIVCFIVYVAYCVSSVCYYLEVVIVFVVFFIIEMSCNNLSIQKFIVGKPSKIEVISNLLNSMY
jgi:hypothetical protein